MAKRVAGVTEKLMECAKEEFLANGYENASLRVIAEKAGSSKGAIYIRYPDKESLYRSLVQTAADGFCELLQSVLSGFNMMPGNEQTQQMLRYSNDGFPKVVDYLYDHFDEFKLLLTSGENSVYQEFIHRVVELDTECTAKYIEASGNDAITSGRLTPELNHLLPVLSIRECLRLSFTICQKPRHWSISAKCGVSIPLDGRPSFLRMEVMSYEWLD